MCARTAVSNSFDMRPNKNVTRDQTEMLRAKNSKHSTPLSSQATAVIPVSTPAVVAASGAAIGVVIYVITGASRYSDQRWR